MKEYCIIENTKRAEETEQVLNTSAELGWSVIGFTQYQILLEREKVDAENTDEVEQSLLHD